MANQHGLSGNGSVGWRPAALFVLVCLALASCPCRGEDGSAEHRWLSTELAVFGSSAAGTWQAPASGGQDVGGVRGPDRGGQRGALGRRLTAGLLSLVLPGAGQYYNGDRQKAYIFVGAEAGVWASYLTFDMQGDNRSDEYRDYAGIFAGASGGSQEEAYWRAVGRYLDSDAYNEWLRREARAMAEEPSGLVGPERAWQWRNEDRLRAYQELRADASRAYSRRDFTTMFAILNRVIAVYDAVRHSVDDKLKGELLGFHVELNVSPSLHRPATGCVLSRRF